MGVEISWCFLYYLQSVLVKTYNNELIVCFMTVLFNLIYSYSTVYPLFTHSLYKSFIALYIYSWETCPPTLLRWWTRCSMSTPRLMPWIYGTYTAPKKVRGHLVWFDWWWFDWHIDNEKSSWILVFWIIKVKSIAGRCVFHLKSFKGLICFGI